MPTRPIAVHTITQDNAAHVLHVVASGLPVELEPGSFMFKLIEAALIADDGNRERLERGFEGVISAVRVYKELPGGVKMLTKIAAGPGPF